jgi:hypothetical protein
MEGDAGFVGGSSSEFKSPKDPSNVLDFLLLDHPTHFTKIKGF